MPKKGYKQTPEHIENIIKSHKLNGTIQKEEHIRKRIITRFNKI